MYHSLYQRYCDEQKNIGNYRELPGIISNPNILDFSTNDYLNFSNSFILKQTAFKIISLHGVGSTGSRLLSGNKAIFERLERQIAEDKNTETSLIFNSGYQANFSVLASILNAKIFKELPIIFFDKLNHSSLYQAIFLSKAKMVRYRHRDLDQLRELLEKYSYYKNKFIVTETLYGMDGDVIDLQNVVNLAQRYKAFLYLDEAHATGVLGKNGYGLSTTVDFKEVPHIVMGTFSKALGTFGAYIACSKIMKNYLINNCHGLIYSSALPPMLIAIAETAWNLVKDMKNERLTLFQNSAYLREKLQKAGYNIGNCSTHIIPIIIGDENRAILIKNELQKRNIIVSAIRPPTVPPGTSRLRLAVTLQHNKQTIDSLLVAMKEVNIA